MDMHSREQYLVALREDYRRASKAQKTRLLNEARRRTRLNRKVLIRKLAHPAPALRQEVERLREQGELRCSDEVARKLAQISPRTIDRLLSRERQVRCLQRGRQASLHPLLYQKVPVKVASEWDTAEVGNVQLDYVGHCGRSTGGEYLHTLSAVDIASSWWEGEPILGRSQHATEAGLQEIRQRLPFRLREIHPDNDTGLLNDLIWRCCRKWRVRMSRSRPYRKNDNAWIEQRNWTHVRQVVGYRRLEAQYAQLNVAQLRRMITGLQNRLWDTLAAGEDASVRPRRRGPAPTLSGVVHRLWMKRMMAGEAA